MLQELADIAYSVAEKWSKIYESEPEREKLREWVRVSIDAEVGGEILNLAKNYMAASLQRAISQRLTPVIDKAVDEWLASGDVVLPEPTEELREAIEEALTSASPAIVARGAKRKRVEMFRLHKKGFSNSDIACQFRITARQAKRIIEAAAMDAERAKKEYELYWSEPLE